MGVFKDDQDAYAFLGEVFNLGLKNEVLVAKMKEAALVMRVDYTDPTAALLVDMANAKLYMGKDIPADLAPDAQLFMTADDGNKFWQGKLNLTMALAKGQVRSKGSLPKMLKLLPLTKELFAEYVALIAASGRPELQV